MIDIIDNIIYPILVTDTQGNIIKKNEALLQDLNLRDFFETKNTFACDIPVRNHLYHKSKDVKFYMNTAVIEDKIFIFIENFINSKNYFISNLSHEIRTPLNGIIGVTSLFQDAKLDVEQKNYLNMLKESSNNLLNLVNNMLDYSKLELNVIKLNIESFYLKDVIDSVYNIMNYSASEKCIKMTYSLDPAIPSFVCGDSSRIQQILINLYSNSIKYTKTKGSIHTEIDLKTNLIEDKLQISFRVIDSGSPEYVIAEEDKNNIFKSYHQLYKDLDNKQSEGTGLGLAICKQLCILMNGDINLESSIANSGTIFKFYIEISQCTDSSVIRPGYLKDKYVLIVDDMITNRMTLCSQLKSAGMIPFPVSSSNEALIYIKNDIKFDIALLDIYLPKFTGVKLAEHIKIARPNLPLIALSSVGDQIYKLGDNLFDNLLIKPVEPQRLLKVIESTLSKKEAKNIEPNNDTIILISSRDTFILKMLEQQLRKLGYTSLISVNSLDECINTVAIRNVDIIILDSNIYTNEFEKIKNYSILLTGQNNCKPDCIYDTIEKPLEIYKLRDSINKYFLYKKHKALTTSFK